MTELGIIICEERQAKNCVIISPHSPFLPEAFGVWEGKKLKGSMERFQALVAANVLALTNYPYGANPQIIRAVLHTSRT